MNSGISLSCMFFAATALASAQPPDITVITFNDAEVPQRILATAKREATRIYREIGVTIEWMEYRGAACDSRLKTFAIRFLSHSTSEHAGMGITALGYALLPNDGSDGFFANVSWSRVRRTAAEHRLAGGLLLGHAVAHELGHLLLGHMRHSSQGLMRNRWSTKDLDSAMKGWLRFSPQEAEAIRSNLIRDGQGRAPELARK